LLKKVKENNFFGILSVINQRKVLVKKLKENNFFGIFRVKNQKKILLKNSKKIISLRFSV
jgi:hypothetical protein